jgi:hypothetical protein
MHFKEQEKLINATIGEVGSECGKLERTLWYTRLKWAGRTILEICQKIISFGYVRVREKNVPPSLMTGFDSALRVAASSSSTAISYGALRPGTRFM